MSAAQNASFNMQRASTRKMLDALSDFAVDGSGLRLRREFVLLSCPEVFVRVPERIVGCMRRLLAMDSVGNVAQAVHDNVVFNIGSSRVPLFALESGGRDRTLFTFRCVYRRCLAFLEVGLFSKRIIFMSFFLKRMPKERAS